ncbi:hypothetical protein D3C81_1439090 [compost metagenome]
MLVSIGTDGEGTVIELQRLREQRRVVEYTIELRDVFTPGVQRHATNKCGKVLGSDLGLTPQASEQAEGAQGVFSEDVLLTGNGLVHCKDRAEQLVGLIERQFQPARQTDHALHPVKMVGAVPAELVQPAITG